MSGWNSWGDFANYIKTEFQSTGPRPTRTQPSPKGEIAMQLINPLRREKKAAMEKVRLKGKSFDRWVKKYRRLKKAADKMREISKE